MTIELKPGLFETNGSSSALHSHLCTRLLVLGIRRVLRGRRYITFAPFTRRECQPGDSGPSLLRLDKGWAKRNPQTRRGWRRIVIIVVRAMRG